MTDQNTHEKGTASQIDGETVPNTTVQLKVDTFNWTLCALLGT